MRRFALLVATFLLLSLTHSQAAPPPQLPPELRGVPGVNIHFTHARDGEMQELASAGFKWVRMDFGWGGIEREKGQYNFAECDRLLSELEAVHITPIFILDYSNRFYDNGQSPQSDEGRQAFAKWAAASVTHFKGKGIVWEMYNEPNIGFWKPHPDVRQYAKLALAVGKAIREAQPNEIYIGPGSSTIDMAFLEACFKAGCLEYWSAVSVHPYRQSDPETVTAEYRKLRALIARYAPADRKIPIISSEWGYSSSWKNFDEQRQAKYLPRELMINALNDVPISIWYDWHEDGTNPADPEHHFGIVHYAAHPGAAELYEPKPAYLAMKTFASTLAGYSFNKRLPVGGNDDYVLLWTDQQHKAACVTAWTTAHEPHAVHITLGNAKFDITNLIGKKEPSIALEQDVLPLTLTDSVQYISVPQMSDYLQIEAAWDALRDVTPFEAPGTVRVSAVLHNPFPHQIVIDPFYRLAPGASTEIAAAEFPLHRQETSMPVTIQFDVKGIGSFSQRTRVVVTNPIIPIMLPPRDHHLHVMLLNPSGEAVRGAATVRNATVSGDPLTADVDLKPGQTFGLVSFTNNGVHQLTYHSLNIESPSDGWLLSVGLKPGIAVGDFDQFKDTDTLSRTYHLVPDGSKSVHSTESLSLGAPPSGPLVPGAVTLKIDYHMDEGWKFLRLAPATEAGRNIDIPSAKLSLWVFGDGQGAIARARFTDATGQTFQADGGKITFTGWQNLQFPSPPRSLRIGAGKMTERSISPSRSIPFSFWTVAGKRWRERSMFQSRR
ncbi:MAG TPA: cellulase family glycosylhydrolase [Tepidisphaeraceae bacterium]|nr:cellulase family glycosylhydrolase [Tepidisphaeraceae bacterium]